MYFRSREMQNIPRACEFRFIIMFSIPLITSCLIRKTRVTDRYGLILVTLNDENSAESFYAWKFHACCQDQHVVELQHLNQSHALNQMADATLNAVHATSAIWFTTVASVRNNSVDF
jgi:hypothetical protein